MNWILLEVIYYLILFVFCGFDFIFLPLRVCQYEEYGENFVDMLDGMFSFVLLDTRDKSFIAARDAIGITPLYIGWGLDGMLYCLGICALEFFFY